MIMSRGCIGRCTFCNNHLINPIFRHRSPGHIFREITHHISSYGIRVFFLCDQLVNGDLVALEGLCDLIISSGKSISWYGSARVRRGMTPQLLQKMKAAGCMGLTYGVESFSERVLSLMNKRTTPEEIGAVLKATKGAGIPTFINLIVGFPGEQEREFVQTLEGIRANRENISEVTYAGPCFINFGTDLYSNPAGYGVKSSGEIDAIGWETIDGANTYDVRLERLSRLEKVLREEGLKANFICRQETG